MKTETPHVMVIDDDEVALTAISDLLEESGYHVRALTSPVGAADVAERDPHLVAVILDLNLPVMRGDNIARVFRSRPALRNIPLVMISSDTAFHLNQIRKKIPYLRVLSKSELNTQLVPLIREVIADYIARSHPPRPWEE